MGITDNLVKSWVFYHYGTPLGVGEILRQDHRHSKSCNKRLNSILTELAFIL